MCACTYMSTKFHPHIYKIPININTLPINLGNQRQKPISSFKRSLLIYLFCQNKFDLTV